MEAKVDGTISTSSTMEVIEKVDNNDMELIRETKVEASPTKEVRKRQRFKRNPYVTGSVSPKKQRLDVSLINTGGSPSKKQSKFSKFVYGNYNQYYHGRRNKGREEDVRLVVFKEHSDVFQDKDMLDIGCNSGMITLEIATALKPKSIVGIDIDKFLIRAAVRNLDMKLKEYPGCRDILTATTFLSANYVLPNDRLLLVEREQYDLIICLSVTKWIHLNFGDSGMKRTFRRMYMQLRPGGKLILEAQEWKGYRRRRHMSTKINENYKKIKFFPQDFEAYLLSDTVGFQSVEDWGIPSHLIKGFQRPIKVCIHTKHNYISVLNVLISAKRTDDSKS